MKKVSILVLCLLMLLSISISSFAGDNQLELDKTSIADGAKDVSTSPEFNLVFTNNVVNMKVKESNMSAIKLVNSKGNGLDVIISMADDQVNPDEKRNVTVTAKNELEKSETYTLIIGKSFSGKNGSTLVDDVKINFTTEGSSSISTAIIVGVVAALIAVFAVTSKKRKSNA